MPHNSTIIICKDEPVGAAVIIVRIKNMKEQIKSCTGCRGYTAKKNRNANSNERGYGCG